MSKKYPAITMKDGERYFFRFNLDERIQHLIFAATVVLLVLTGMPLKFSHSNWAQHIYPFFGGTKGAPIVHKICGAIMLLVLVYHVYRITVNIYRNHVLPAKKAGNYSLVKVLLKQCMVPNLKDALDIRDLMKYLLFFTNVRPQGDNFTWKEKFDYWAPFWGCIVIGVTGLIMWNKEIASHIMPGAVINFCLIAHSDEALLAGLFLFIWHWYNVHYSASVFPMGMVFLTGYLPEELMIEEHYEYYVKVMKENGLEHEIKPPHGGLPDSDEGSGQTMEAEGGVS
jgi:cytochrome b subunit of formate dehydrogenase